MDDLIPEDYTLIDVAYYYHWKKDAPMKFFYRIFKKNRVLLKRRKRKLEAEESATTDTSANGAKMSRTEEQNGKGVGSVVQDDSLGGRDQSVDIRSCSAPTTKNEDSVKQSKEEKVKQPSVSTENSETKSVTTATFTGEKKDVVKKDESSWLYIPISSESKVEPKSDPEPVKMETDEPEEKKKPVDPVREVKIISLLGPGKTSIVSETIKKPETKENDAPDANASQNVAAITASPTEQASSDIAKATNGETKSSDPKNKSEEKISISNASSNVTKVPPSTMSSPSQQKSRKPGNGSQILSVINNLAKKQQNLEAASKDVKVPAVIHGQTTITKRVVENGPQLNGSPSSSTTTATATPSSAATTNAATTTGNLPHTSHHIPSGTTITVKQVATTPTSPKTNSVLTPNGKTPASTPGTINSNSSIQTPKPMISTNGTSSTPTPSLLSNSKPKPAVADLRQYRKCPPTSESAATSPLTLTRPPIVPQLTLSGRVKSQGAGTITTASNQQQQQVGSHRLPASTSAGIASSRPLSLSGNSLGRLPGSFSSVMSVADQQKALQMLRMPISSMTNKSPNSNSPSPTTGSSSPSNSTTSNMTSSVTAAQLPSNRLQLKVQPPTAGISPFQAAFQSSLYSHMASESIWKYPLLGQTPTTTQSGSPTSKSPTSNGKSMNSLPKTLNQGIRQIPNPSLLAKQQALAAEQFMMAMAAANYVSNANAKTSPKQ